MNANTWLMLLIAAVIVDGYLQWRDRRRWEHLDKKMNCVINVLVVWAQTWGQPAEQVKVHLDHALKTQCEPLDEPVKRP